MKVDDKIIDGMTKAIGQLAGGNKTKLIPNLNTLADVIDRLIVEVNKLSYFENMKRQEHAKAEPDSNMIAHWDNLSRDCCEYRSLLKNEINRVFTQVVLHKEYRTLNELRTFRSPPRNVADLLSDRSYALGDMAFSGELAAAIKEELDDL